MVATVAVLIITGGCDWEQPPPGESSRRATSPAVAPRPTRLPPSWWRASKGRSWPWATSLPQGIDCELRGMLRAVVGTVQGAHQACPRQPRVLHRGASGYFEYFDEAAGDPEEGYYSYELGSWRGSPQQQLRRSSLWTLVPPDAVARGGPRRQRRGAVYPRLHAPSTLQLQGETWLHCRGGGEAVGGALRGGHRRGLLRPRAQLRALLPQDPQGRG